MTTNSTKLSKSLCLKQQLGNSTAITSAMENVLGYSSISVSITTSYPTTFQVFFTNFSATAVAVRQLEYQMTIAANTPTTFILPVRGERVQYLVTPQGAVQTTDTILVNTVLGQNTNYKVL